MRGRIAITSGVLALAVVAPAARATPTTFKSLAPGRYHTCSRKADDNLYCWGSNGLGQTTSPAGIGTVKAVTSGYLFSCAIKADDTVACWGFNTYGQTDVPSGLGTVKGIDAGGDHACAVKSDDSVVCWGNNSVAVPSGLTAKSVSAGGWDGNVNINDGNTSCAVKTDDSLACWGADEFGQATVPATLGSVKAVSVGGFHTCAIKADDTVACWGAGGYGQTSPPGTLGTVKAISAGGLHTCAIKSDDTVACWGNSDYFQTGPPFPLGTAKAISTGAFDTCAIKSDDTAVCWGDNAAGQTTAPRLLTEASDDNGFEGDAMSISGSFTDPAQNGVTITANNTEGTFTDHGDGTWAWSFTPPDDRSTHTVTVTGTGAYGYYDTDTFVYSAANKEPVLTKLSFSTGGAAHCKLTLQTTFSDAGSADTHSGTIYWGDGPDPTTFTTSPVNKAHTYTAAGTYPVHVTVYDDDSLAGTERTKDWTVYNKATGPLAPINSDGSSVFALASTVDVIVKVVTCAGAEVSDLSPQVSLTRLKDTKKTAINEDVSSATADSGTTMHWDAGNSEYVFHLGTLASQFNGGNDLTAGEYRVRVSDPSFDHLTASNVRALQKTFHLLSPP
jgi:hypothetical protein